MGLNERSSFHRVGQQDRVVIQANIGKILSVVPLCWFKMCQFGISKSYFETNLTEVLRGKKHQSVQSNTSTFLCASSRKSSPSQVSPRKELWPWITISGRLRENSMMIFINWRGFPCPHPVPYTSKFPFEMLKWKPVSGSWSSLTRWRKTSEERARYGVTS